MLYYCCGISGDSLGSHEVEELAFELPKESKLPDDMFQSVSKVSRYYQPSRYPNRQPSNAVPAEVIKKKEAENAIDAASKVLEFVDKHFSKAKQ